MENKKFLIGLGIGLAVLVIIMVVVVIAGGGGNKTKKKTGPPTVILWTPNDKASVYDPFAKKLASGVKVKNASGKTVTTKIKLTVVEKNSDTYEEELTNAIARGEGPDIAMVRDDWYPKYYKFFTPAKYTQTKMSDSVTDFKAKVPDFVGGEVVQNNRVYGFPVASDPLVMFFNRDIIKTTLKKLKEEAKSNGEDVSDADKKVVSNPPRNWDDFQEYVRLTTTPGDEGFDVSGAAIGTSTNIAQAPYILYLMMMQNGTNFYSSGNKEAAFHLPAKSPSKAPYYPGTKALELYTSFSQQDGDYYTWNDELPDALNVFIDGKIGIMFDFASAGQTIKQVNPKLNFTITTVPQVKGTLKPVTLTRFWAMSVNRESQSQDYAWNVINFLSAKGSRKTYLNATKREPLYKEDLPSATSTTSVDGAIKLSQAVYKPDAARYDAIFGNMIIDVVKNDMTPQESIEAAAKKVNDLIAGKLQ